MRTTRVWRRLLGIEHTVVESVALEPDARGARWRRHRWWDNENPDDDLVEIGSHYGSLVNLLEALANPCHEVQRLLAMADEWRSD